jgi:hypothetical protein
MAKVPEEDQYSDEETARRRDEALRRALSTPPKRHSEMKLGKGNIKPIRKLAAESNTRPASKGRVHKGKSRGSHSA